MMTVAEFITNWSKVELKKRSATDNWPVELSDAQILNRLLALNLERAR